MSEEKTKKDEIEFVSRGGWKLWEAIHAFDLNVEGKVCVDLGCSVGGFVDAWLKAGAKKVYAVDTAYGQLAWKLRQDERVVVLERENALHVEVGEACDFVSVDLGWTKQEKAVPAALRWLKDEVVDAKEGGVVTLVKPHYEETFEKREGVEGSEEGAEVKEKKKGKGKGKWGKGKGKGKGRKKKAVTMSEEDAARVNEMVLEEVMPRLGVEVKGSILSPLKGAKGGNIEYLAMLIRKEENGEKDGE